ncbi:MAG: spore coat protein CotJB, partial [Clostridium celatum]|nr:spore coat protein CotJB [Clostridium celatum]
KLISSKLRKLIWDYEQDYGPLTNFGTAYIQNPEAWIDTPWPWENNKED